MTRERAFRKPVKSQAAPRSDDLKFSGRNRGLAPGPRHLKTVLPVDMLIGIVQKFLLY